MNTNDDEYLIKRVCSMIKVKLLIIILSILLLSACGGATKKGDPSLNLLPCQNYMGSMNQQCLNELKAEKQAKENEDRISRDKLLGRDEESKLKRRNDIKSFVKKYPVYKKYEVDALAGKVTVGMPEILAYNAVHGCYPNSTTTKYGTRKQFVCGDSPYHWYFYTDEKGEITAIQK